MKRAEAMRRIADLHSEWALKHADSVTVPPLDQDPYAGMADRGLHAVDLYAPAEAEDELNAAIVAILAEIDDDEPAPVAAAAGHDVTPGHDELHHYWTRGEGLARWADSPTPWTTLVALLSKIPEVGPVKAKTFASRWFIEVFGFAAGSDLNRVTHGKPPRGDVVGPG